MKIFNEDEIPEVTPEVTPATPAEGEGAVAQ